MSITLPPLPYAYNALEPHISQRTVEIHHDKHHAKYVANTNGIVEGMYLEKADLVTIIRTAKYANNVGLFNNAAQVWNHSFYWECMKPGGGGEPTGAIADLINSSFGSYAAFREKFEAAANSAFGSGWTWVVLTPKGLIIQNTEGAYTPVAEQGIATLLTLDVWEHAYYLDYQNVRANYVTAFLDHLVNWDFVNSQIPK